MSFNSAKVLLMAFAVLFKILLAYCATAARSNQHTLQLLLWHCAATMRKKDGKQRDAVLSLFNRIIHDGTFAVYVVIQC